MASLFDRYISDTMTEADRREAGITGIHHLRTAPAPRRRHQALRYVLAGTAALAVPLGAALMVVGVWP